MEVMDRIFTCLCFLVVGNLWLQVTARIATECDKYDQRIDHCWLKHIDVPNCKGIDPLIACSENNVNQIPSDCSIQTRIQAQRVLGISQLLHRVVCARRSDILEEFISRPQCWQRARICLSSLPISFEEIVYRSKPPMFDLETDVVVPIAERERIVASECYEEGEAIQMCYSSDPGCLYLKEFINLVIDNSMCRLYRIEDCPVCAHNNSALNRLTAGENENSADKNATYHYFSLIFIFVLLYF